jgi:DNA invertase Pin-like site-specific DNA recombinase
MGIKAVYVRVSSRKQDEQSQAPDLDRWAKSQDGEVRFYRDVFTGKTMDRPGWNKLDSDIRTGKVESVTVWRLDRLGRTARGLTALFEELQGRKVNLVSLRDGLDLSTPAGRLMANVLASVAQYETEVRHERIIAGLEVAREKGTRSGRAIGRPADVHTRVKVTAEQEAMIKSLKSQGEKVAVIARATGLSRPTVYKILSA